MKALLTLTAGLAFAAAAPLWSSAMAQAEAPPAAVAPSTAEVLRNVRAAVGQDRLHAFGRAFEIAEKGADGGIDRIRFGTAKGELRNGDEFLYDGSLGWQFDSRRNMFFPASLRQREKAAWPLWIRGHWWLDPRSGVQARLLAGESNSREVALALSLPGGVVGATVYVDRATWLPDRVVVPYERGPFTQRYRDYRTVRGVRFPFAVDTSYRNSSTSAVVSVLPVAPEPHFARPKPPLDHRFDPSRPAALETRQGAPFPSGTPGHVYVRAVADDVRSGWWHLDSGADASIIDESVAEALHMEVIGTHRSAGADGKPVEGTWRRAKSLTVGRLRIENAVFRAMDLSGNNAPAGERRMGTLGYDLFARAVVEWGDRGRRVRICDPAGYRLPRGASWQRLEHIDSTPAFRGVAEGHSGLFQIDTGNAGTVDFAKPFHERNALLRNRPTRQVQVLGSGGSFAVEVGRLADFKFAGQDYRDLEVAFRTGGVSREGSAGTIGRDVLERFTLVFDYPHQRLAFLPAGRSGFCS
ncbi:MAG TPA: retropepsin-like aspartic protease [Allosphingosinicella sp.]|jgi:hypothetical protein|nr:retropepsin-like aspartic protease [Allosphingosinicella sp.]